MKLDDSISTDRAIANQTEEPGKTGGGFKFSLPANKFTTAGRAVLAPNTMMNFATPQ